MQDIVTQLAEAHDLTPQQAARVCDLIWSDDWSGNAPAMKAAAETYIWQRKNAAALNIERRKAHEDALRAARRRWHYLTGLIPPPPSNDRTGSGFNKSVYHGRKYGYGSHG